GEGLQRQDEAGIHVVLRGQPGDGPRADGQRRRVPGRRVLRDAGVRPGPGELDPQSVVLLAQRVDLELELLGLRHQGLQVRVGRSRLRRAAAPWHDQGERSRDRSEASGFAYFAHSVARYWNRRPAATDYEELLPGAGPAGQCRPRGDGPLA